MATAEAVLRHPHLATPPPEGRVRVDMHMHTMWSGDAQTTPDELAVAVAETGIEVLCVTDHASIDGAVRFEASGELGCRVIVGQEVRTEAGEIIGLWLSERIPFGLRPEEVCTAIRDQGGVVYIPHPFDELRHALRPAVLEKLVDAGLVDAVEVFNAKVKAPSSNRRASEFALDRGLRCGAGSDSHEPSAVGAAFAEMDDFGDAASFLAALGSADVIGHPYDVARTWRPRIVPSTSTP